RPARESDRAHRSLGPGGDESHLLDRRHGVGDLCGEFDLALGRRAEARPIERRLAHGFDRLGICVPEQQRSPRLHPVAVAVAAALSIAYSPETLYAAIGSSKRSRAARITSRYGRAGLIISTSAPSATSSSHSRSASRTFAGSI